MILRLICYDIENDKLRNKLSKHLKIYGFTRMQKSVFCGQITNEKWIVCKKTLTKLFELSKKESDSLYTLIINKNNFTKMEIYGEAPDVELILDQRNVEWF